MKYLFLDTNIFLHFKSYTDIKWEDIVGTSQYTIVVAPIVIDELDKHKNSSNKKVNKKAKSTIGKFAEIVEGTSTNNLAVKLLVIRPEEAVFNQFGLSKSQQDDSLLATILSYTIQAGDEVILITNDLGPLIRAQSFNIKCIRMPEEYRLEEELDETEKENRQLKQELIGLKNLQPKVLFGFSNGTNQLKITPVKMQFTKAEYIQRESSINKRNYGHLRKYSEIKEPIFKALNAFSRLSDSQVDDYNKELDAYYIEFEKYLGEEYEHKIKLSSCFEIELNLNNTGTAPANDIDIYLHFPDGFKLSEKRKKGPKKPEPPYQPKSQWDFGLRSSILPIIDTRGAFPKVNTGPELTKLKKTNSYDVEFKVRDLKHNQNVGLPKLFVCFENIESMSSFHVDYTLMIANLPNKIEGQLHVIIER